MSFQKAKPRVKPEKLQRSMKRIENTQGTSTVPQNMSPVTVHFCFYGEAWSEIHKNSFAFVATSVEDIIKNLDPSSAQYRIGSASPSKNPVNKETSFACFPKQPRIPMVRWSMPSCPRGLRFENSQRHFVWRPVQLAPWYKGRRNGIRKVWSAIVVWSLIIYPHKYILADVERG